MLKAKSLSPSPTDEAFAAVWAADYHRALALLHNLDLPGCASMRARVWLRLERYDRVIDEYNRRSLAGYDTHDRVQLCGFAATAFGFLGEHERAIQIITDARLNPAIQNDPVLLAFCWYTHARIGINSGNAHFTKEPLSEARCLLERAKDNGCQPAYFLEIATARAHLCDAESWLFAVDVDNVNLEKTLLDAAAYVSMARNVDRFLEAALLSNLAGLVWRKPLENARRYLTSRIDVIAWTDLTDRSASRIRRALLCNSVLFGADKMRATLDRRRASSLATRFGISLDALLFDDWNDPSKFLSELRFAVSISLDLKWDIGSGAALFDLGVLASVRAPFDLVLAERLSMIYEQFVPGLSKKHFPTHDPATVGRKIFVDGCMAKARGDIEYACAALKKSAILQSDNFVSADLAICGLERYTMSRDTEDLIAARTFIATYRSSFAHRLTFALANALSCGTFDFPYLGMYGITNEHSAKL